MRTRSNVTAKGKTRSLGFDLTPYPDDPTPIEISSKVTIQHFWPNPQGPEIPEHLTEPVKKAFRQAEINFPRRGCEEAAGVMYRRALEMALKEIDQNTTGTLATRIAKAADKGVLTKAVAEWAHEIKNLGNEAAHETDGIDREELAAIRGITEMVLRYVFTLPGMVRELRNQPVGEIETGEQ